MAMHSNWNPWHGCRKCSEGCENCYVHYLDSMRSKSTAVHQTATPAIHQTATPAVPTPKDIPSNHQTAPPAIYKTKTGFDYPVSKDRAGRYKIKSGEMISVCMTSDFFLEEADAWRPDAWAMMHERSDVIFLLLTKRIQRVRECLPANWNDGWDNIFLNVTCENQSKVDARIPALLDLPFKHKGVQCAPLLGPVSIGGYLDSGQIEQVTCGGENYGGTRPCDYDWVKTLREECVSRNITFCFMETGTVFIKDGVRYRIPGKQLQNNQAYKSGMTFRGKEMHFDLVDALGLPIPADQLHVPHFREKCGTCSFRILCNGCFECGACDR